MHPHQAEWQESRLLGRQRAADQMALHSEAELNVIAGDDLRRRSQRDWASPVGRLGWLPQ